jgi:hypothetical protein
MDPLNKTFTRWPIILMDGVKVLPIWKADKMPAAVHLAFNIVYRLETALSKPIMSAGLTGFLEACCRIQARV